MLTTDRYLSLQAGDCVVLRQDRFQVRGHEEIAGRKEPILLNTDTGERLFAGVFAAHLLRIEPEVTDRAHVTPAAMAQEPLGEHVLEQLRAMTPSQLSDNHEDIDVPEVIPGREVLPLKTAYLVEFDLMAIHS